MLFRTDTTTDFLRTHGTLKVSTIQWGALAFGALHLSQGPTVTTLDGIQEI